jgi:DNA-binding transcriptional MocR family regulator
MEIGKLNPSLCKFHICEPHQFASQFTPPAGMGAAFLSPGTDDAEMARRAARKGIETRPLSLYTIDRAPPPGLVLGFASIDRDAIESGVVALARCLL